DVVVSRFINGATEKESFPLNSIVVDGSRLGAGLYSVLNNISSADNQFKEPPVSGPRNAANADALFDANPQRVEEKQTNRRNKPSM
ncbi:hypothetical protein LRQ11_06810, partial [Pseudomonas sp. MAFF 311095]